MNAKYLEIAKHYEKCLETHGDTHLGVGWPREGDTHIRHRVMAELFAHDPSPSVSVLDFGCGLSHFYAYLSKERTKRVRYIGLDVSPKFAELSRKKYPGNRYLCLDILSEEGKGLPAFDYAVCNGVYTQKRSLSQAQMTDFLKRQVKILFSRSRKGMAFNVMSPEVDWKKRGSFHLGFDELAGFLAQEVTRRFVFRHDYGLYEYTVYLYKEGAL